MALSTLTEDVLTQQMQQEITRGVATDAYKIVVRIINSFKVNIPDALEQQMVDKQDRVRNITMMKVARTMAKLKYPDEVDEAGNTRVSADYKRFFTEMKKDFLSNRPAEEWNKLPDVVDTTLTHLSEKRAGQANPLVPTASQHESGDGASELNENLDALVELYKKETGQSGTTEELIGPSFSDIYNNSFTNWLWEKGFKKNPLIPTLFWQMIGLRKGRNYDTTDDYGRWTITFKNGNGLTGKELYGIVPSTRKIQGTAKEVGDPPTAKNQAGKYYRFTNVCNSQVVQLVEKVTYGKGFYVWQKGLNEVIDWPNTTYTVTGDRTTWNQRESEWKKHQKSKRRGLECLNDYYTAVKAQAARFIIADSCYTAALNLAATTALFNQLVFATPGTEQTWGRSGTFQTSVGLTLIAWNAIIASQYVKHRVIGARAKEVFFRLPKIKRRAPRANPGDDKDTAGLLMKYIANAVALIVMNQTPLGFGGGYSQAALIAVLNTFAQYTERIPFPGIGGTYTTGILDFAMVAIISGGWSMHTMNFCSDIIGPDYAKMGLQFGNTSEGALKGMFRYAYMTLVPASGKQTIQGVQKIPYPHVVGEWVWDYIYSFFGQSSDTNNNLNAPPPTAEGEPPTLATDAELDPDRYKYWRPDFAYLQPKSGEWEISVWDQIAGRLNKPLLQVRKEYERIVLELKGVLNSSRQEGSISHENHRRENFALTLFDEYLIPGGYDDSPTRRKLTDNTRVNYLAGKLCLFANEKMVDWDKISGSMEEVEDICFDVMTQAFQQTPLPVGTDWPGRKDWAIANVNLFEREANIRIRAGLHTTPMGFEYEYDASLLSSSFEIQLKNYLKKQEVRFQRDVDALLAHRRQVMEELNNPSRASRVEGGTPDVVPYTPLLYFPIPFLPQPTNPGFLGF